MGAPCGLNIFFGAAGGRPRRSNDEFFTLSEFGNVKTCMPNVWNKWIIFYSVFLCTVYYWILADCRKCLPSKKLFTRCFTHFQYLSDKFILFWFWPQPITRHETDIQKWLWPRLLPLTPICKFIRLLMKEMMRRNKTITCGKVPIGRFLWWN